MGGAVSSGRDNNELIDNLMGGNYIRTRGVERAFRALDRAEYMTPEDRDQAYKDLAWRSGQLHISAPCIYSEVMESLELRPGLSFLNIGSGTGYLSTLAGLLLGSAGVNHGVEVHSMVVEYANKKLGQFIENSPTLDEFDFCEPKFYHGNGLCLAPQQAPYDRVYCGAGCPEEYQNYFKQLVKVGGVLVMPLNDNLVQVRRVAPAQWSSRTLLNVSFATLISPSAEQRAESLRLDEQAPARLQALCRRAVRSALRGALVAAHAALREPPARAPPAKRACPRRICIPLDEQSDEGLNGLHDLDHNNGGAEMNALLSLVLRMGRDRGAGALRLGELDSDSASASDSDAAPARSSDYDDTDSDEPGADEDAPEDVAPAALADSPPGEGAGSTTLAEDLAHVVYFALQEHRPRRDAPPAAPPAPPAAPATRAAPAAPAAPATRAAPAAAHSQDGSTDATEEKTEELRQSQDRTPKKRSSKEYSHKDRNKDKSARSSKDASPRSDDKSLDSKTHEENPEVPAEVEIYLGKTAGAGGTSTMEWDTAPEPKHSSDEETTESTSKAKEETRQKLDSGIGEENSPSSWCGTSSRERDSSAEEPSDTSTEAEGTGRRRRQKRSFCARDSSTDSGSESGARAHRAGGGDDARRVRLSVLMKRAVRDLPLPYAMKIYLNYGRCFQV